MYVWGNFRFHNTSRDDDEFLRFPSRAPLPHVDESLLQKTCSLAAGSKHTVLVTSSGHLLGFGSNHFGQLGKVGVFLPSPNALPFRGRSEPVEVACGKRHTLIRTRDGFVYAAGDNSMGQLGYSVGLGTRMQQQQPGTMSNDFVELPLSGVIQISANANASFALSDKGVVYSWGFAGNGHLGHGDRGEVPDAMTDKELKMVVNVKSPKAIKWLMDKRIRVLEISVGREHFVCRSDSDVFTCGEGFFGKLGTGSLSSSTTPQRVAFPPRKTPERLLQVSAGDNHTAVLKLSGEVGTVVYVFGRGRGDNSSSVPCVVESPSNLLRISVGVNASVAALTTEGALFVCGDFRPLPSGVTASSATKGNAASFQQIMALADFFITHVCISGSTFTAIADDSKTHRVISTVGDNETADDNDEHVVKRRYHQRFDVVLTPEERQTHRSVVDNYEAKLLAFYQCWLGDSDGAAYFEGVERPAAINTAAALHKRGAHGLQVRDKVRLWMTDVYALGIIVSIVAAGEMTSEAVAEDASTGGSSACRRVTVEWMRDDWQPEEIDLWSDDETLDEENPNRWQALWYPPNEVLQSQRV